MVYFEGRWSVCDGDAKCNVPPKGDVINCASRLMGNRDVIQY